MNKLLKKIIFIIYIITINYTFLYFPAYASDTDGTIYTGTNIGYAWSSFGGYVNFALPTASTTGVPNPNGYVHVTDTAVTGYAWDSNYGWLNLSPSISGVTNNEEGALGGYAWSAGGGWISFSGVTIDDNGKFTGTTPNSTAYGKLTFDCTYCDVKTDWRKKSIRSPEEKKVSKAEGGSGAVPAPPKAPPEEPTVPMVPPIIPEAKEPAAPKAEELPEIPTETEEDGLPEELFDIRLIIDSKNITSIKKLVSRVTFESFGRVPTPVELVFSIIDSNKKVVASKKDSVVIETEGVLITKFSDLEELPPGKYVLKLHTKYNIDVEDDFEASFTIKEEEKNKFLTIPYITGGAVVISGVLLFLIRIIRLRKV